MTDTPSRPPETPAAPESATTETPVRPGIPAQATGPAAPQAPNWNAAPGWGRFPPAPVPGWEWSNGWIPKPGIIPLRPLSIGDILSGSFTLLRGHWRTVLPITAAIALVTQIASALITNAAPKTQNLSSPFAHSQDPSADLRKNLSTLADTIPALGAVELISVVAGALSAGMIILIVSKAVLGRSSSLSEAWASARPRLLQLIGLTVLMTLIIGGVLAISFSPALLARSSSASDGALAGLTMLVLPGSVIALWLAISMVLAAPALMLERQGIRSALARSFRLVRGSWWRVFGIVLLLLIMNTIVMGMVGLPFTAGSFFAQGISADTTTTTTYQVLACIGATVGATITLPILTGGIAFLYMDQRIRREALDIDLATAAGIPHYTHA
jgi:hypothetical protein